METVGEYLKNKRLLKSISIEEVVRGTNIPRRYIEDIENNDFSNFPGEVYVRGYIRSYASFLDADPDYAIKLYEKKILEAKEVPLDLLIGKKDSVFDKVNFKKLSVMFSVLLLFILLGYMVLSWVLSKQYKVLVDNDNVRTVLKSFSEGEEFKDNSYSIPLRVKLVEVKNNGNDIVLSINDSIYHFLLKQKSLIDFNMDGRVDAEIKYESFSESKPTLRISIFKSKEVKAKEESVFLENALPPIEFSISSDKLVWVSILADSSEEVPFYLNQGEVKQIKVDSRLILKTSDSKSIKIKANNKEIVVPYEGPVYIKFDVMPGSKGSILKISYLE
ncbi:MAG: helix-turn-helix domain-containing protein [Brevinematia bacterium]